MEELESVLVETDLTEEDAEKYIRVAARAFE
jgi:hypothetical protein